MKLLLFICLLPGAVLAQSGFNGSFTNTTNGVLAVMNLEADGLTLSGSYAEGEYVFGIAGTISGNRISGVFRDMMFGIEAARFTGYLRDDQSIELALTVNGQEQSALFSRQTLQNKPDSQTQRTFPSNTTTPRNDGHTRDQLVVGTWQYQNVMNSGGVSVATVLIFVLETNTRYAQYSKGVGGGSDWSYTSGDAELLQQGNWHTTNGTLYLQPDGEKEYTAAATYKLVDGRLVTEDVNGRKIWSRQ